MHIQEGTPKRHELNINWVNCWSMVHKLEGSMWSSYGSIIVDSNNSRKFEIDSKISRD